MIMLIIEFVSSMSSLVSHTRANLSDWMLLNPLHKSIKSSGAATFPATAIMRLSLGSGRGLLETGIGSRGTASCAKSKHDSVG